MSVSGAYGYYGKLPCAGDFLRRGLSQSFVTAWDAWVQTALVSSQISLGEERWQACYNCAPIWRFALPPGLCGNSGVAGIVMPSVDKVGRCFPFCIAAELPLAPWAAFLAVQPVIERLELAALRMLEDNTPLTQLDEILADMPSPGLVGATPASLQSGASVWVAAVHDQSRVFFSYDLPDDTEHAVALFDLNAPFWSKASLRAGQGE